MNDDLFPCKDDRDLRIKELDVLILKYERSLKECLLEKDILSRLNTFESFLDGKVEVHLETSKN